jgi:serine/threonine protein kinase/uncharacterized protein YegL
VKRVSRVLDSLEDGKRVLREVRILQFLKHQNIINLVEVYAPSDAKELYLVTDLMDMDLHQLIYSTSAPAITSDHREYFTWQIMCALRFMHRANVMHRDIKPANVLVRKHDCTLKICDFGLARGSAGEGEGESRNACLTEYVVTRWYRAPEVLISESYGASIDVWSAGCILAELIHRKPIFPGKDALDQLKCIIKVLGSPSEDDLSWIPERAPARKFVSKVGTTADSVAELSKDPLECCILRRMLMFNPDKRSTTSELLQDAYLKSYHEDSEGEEQPANSTLDWSFDSFHLTRQGLQERFLKECSWIIPDKGVLEEEGTFPAVSGSACYVSQPAPEPSPCALPDGRCEGWLPRSEAYALMQQAPSEWFQDGRLPEHPLSTSPELQLAVVSEFQCVPASETRRVWAVASFSTTVDAGSTLDRLGVDVVCVLDVSASMRGAKLEQVKASLAFLVGEMKENDRLCIVAFNASASVFLPLTVMNADGKTAGCKIAKDIQAYGGTSISIGLALAAEVLTRRTQGNEISVVLLLSDGETNNDDGQGFLILRNPRHKFPAGVRLYSFGYGANHDVELMSRLAHRCGGAYFFAQAHEDFLDHLAGCLSTVVGVAVPRPVFRLITDSASGCAVAQLHGPAHCAPAADNGPPWVEIGPLGSDASRDVVFELDLPTSSSDSECTVVVESCCELGMPVVARATLYISRRGSTPCEAEAQPFVLAHRTRVEVAAAFERAAQQAADNNMEEARSVLEDMRQQLRASSVADTPLIRGLAEDLARCAQCYSSRNGSRAGHAQSLASAAAHLQQQPSPVTPCYRTPNSADMALRAEAFRRALGSTAEPCSPGEAQPEPPEPCTPLPR